MSKGTINGEINLKKGLQHTGTVPLLARLGSAIDAGREPEQEISGFGWHARDPDETNRRRVGTILWDNRGAAR